MIPLKTPESELRQLVQSLELEKVREQLWRVAYFENGLDLDDGDVSITDIKILIERNTVTANVKSMTKSGISAMEKVTYPLDKLMRIPLSVLTSLNSTTRPGTAP